MEQIVKVTATSNNSLISDLTIVSNTLQYSSIQDSSGTAVITVVADDGQDVNDTTIARFTVTITPVDDAPIAHLQAPSVSEDELLEISLSGHDPEGAELTYGISSPPLHGTANLSEDTLVYTPEADFSGNDSLSFTVSDGGLVSESALILITVTPFNDQPTVTDRLDRTIAEDAGLQEVVLGAGPGGGSDEQSQTVTVTAFSSNSNLIADPTVSGDTLRYTPFPDSSGMAQITAIVSDGQATNDTAIVAYTVTVTAVDDAPSALSQTVSTFEDTSLRITLAGHDPEGSPLSYNISTPTLNGAVSLVGATATYNPDPDFNGDDGFEFTANDGGLTSAPAAVTITVAPVDDLPPEVPTLSSPTNDAPDQDIDLVLSWSATDRARAYSVQVADNASFERPVIDTTGVLVASLRTGGLHTGTTYYWRVSSVGPDNRSDWSRSFSFTTYTPDTAPPESPTNVAVTGLSEEGWSASETFSLTLTEPEDESGIARIYFKVGEAPTSDHDTTGSAFADGQFSVVLPDDGTHVVHVWLVDNAGNADHTTASPVALRYDSTPPRMTAIPPSSQAIGRDFGLTVEIDDIAPLDEVKLYYRRGGVTEFTAQPMSEETPGSFSATIPAADIGYRGVQYYFSARDLAGNSSTFPKTGSEAPVGIQVEFDDFVSEEAGPAGRWRMVSIPAHPDNGAPLEVLTDLGPYDNTQWRLFRFVEGLYREFTQSDVGDFQPGRAFWLIARTQEIRLRTGRGQTTALNEPFEVSLPPGWTDLGNPFAFPVRWQDIVEASGLPDGVAGPYEFDGTTWSYPTSADRLLPWRGYAVKNSNSGALRLQIPPIASEGPEKPVVVAPVPNGWSLRIQAKTAEAADTHNYIGFLPGADREWDTYDLPEPPSKPEGRLRLYFRHDDWNRFPGNYTSDFRSPSNLENWDFVVESDVAGQPAELSVVSARFPAGWRVVMVDLDGGVRLEIADGASFPIVLSAERRFRVFVGAKHLVDDATSGFQTTLGIHSLNQNHPNPFNSATKIGYVLGNSSHVELTIHDVLGSVVAVLEDEAKEAGHFSTFWDGTDTEGNSVASGMYFYVLETDARRLIGKMMLLR